AATGTTSPHGTPSKRDAERVNCSGSAGRTATRRYLAAGLWVGKVDGTPSRDGEGAGRNSLTAIFEASDSPVGAAASDAFVLVGALADDVGPGLADVAGALLVV